MEYDYKLITEEEAAKILGVPVMTVTRWRWKKQNLRPIKIGKNIRYVKHDVMTLMIKRNGSRHRQPSQPNPL